MLVQGKRWHTVSPRDDGRETYHFGRRALCADSRKAGRESWGRMAFIRGQPIVMGLGENSLRDNLEVMVKVGMGMGPGAA